MRVTTNLLAAPALLMAVHGSCIAKQFVPAGIALHKTRAGWVATDARGMSLYTFDTDLDTPGKSKCLHSPPVAAAGTNVIEGKEASALKKAGIVFGEEVFDDFSKDCAQFWPPALAPADAKADGEWSVAERDDGSKQWALHDKPLYRCAKDPYPGATFCEDLQNRWHIAFLPAVSPPEIVIALGPRGRVLTNSRGMTLYTRTDKAGGKTPCAAQCLQNWSPLEAPAIGRDFGDWSVVQWTDGVKQWAYKGAPLYSYKNDVAPLDMNGNGADGAWTAAVLDPPPPVPSWVTVQLSDMGEVLADAKGKTIYPFRGQFSGVRKVTCNDECLKANWQPLTAPADTKPVGNFAVVVNPDGMGQWTFKGNFLYTFKRDEKPGQILGDKFGNGYGPFPGRGLGWWRIIYSSCMCVPGSHT